MRAFFMATLLALLIGVPVAGAAAHDGWFVRVCSAKTRSGSHSLGVLRRPARIQLVLDQGPDPRRNRPPPAGFTRWRGSPCAAARPRRPPTSNRTSMSVSGSAITSSSVWNLTITKITRRTGMIRMIVPANNTRHQLK